ncbi:MAG: DNA polymerase III subunit gamma/tau [Candidatus Omnitrophota bacterium]|nr:DNA polymerase III subunit gamma/tau [Candidatus Omnitrophota bacterium]
MSYLVLARKFRPQTFDQIIGQEHIVTTLKNAIKTERLAHAYLFCGQRGVGKTSAARILAKALNCVKGPTVSPCGECEACKEIASSISMDVLEIDGASNRGIDEIRNLRENVKFSPIKGKFKIYIIDEVHMLTEHAFNALLKTLEEPPAHVKFIFATTQPYKLPLTILSRCQRFDFRIIPMDKILAKLRQIIDREKLKVRDDALFYIARSSQGSMRDAESILDQVASFSEGEVGFEDVISVLGIFDQRILFEFTQAVIAKDAPGLLNLVGQMMNSGRNGDRFLSGLVGYFRNLVMAKLSDDPSKLINLPPESISQVVAQSHSFSVEELVYIINLLTNTQLSIKKGVTIRIALEIAAIKIARRGTVASLNEVLDKLNELESKLGGTAERPAAENPVAEDPATEHSVTQNPVVGNLPDEPLEDPKKTGLNLSGVKQIWPELLERVKKQKMSVGTFLAEGEPVKVENNVITLGFSAGMPLHKESLEDIKNRTMVENSFKHMLGQKIKIDITTVDSLADKALPENPRASSAPIIQSALEVFKGRIIKRSG